MLTYTQNIIAHCSWCTKEVVVVGGGSGAPLPWRTNLVCLFRGGQIDVLSMTQRIKSTCQMTRGRCHEYCTDLIPHDGRRLQ